MQDLKRAVAQNQILTFREENKNFNDIAIDQVAESWASRIKYVLPKSVVLISGQQAYTFPTGAMVEVIRLV